jgi:hypothetical protein
MSLLGTRNSGSAIASAASMIATTGVDFIFDLDTVVLDAKLADDEGDFAVTTKFVSNQSLITRLATAHPERAGAPPAAFWQLPQDAHLAYFYGGIDQSEFETPRDAIARVIDQQLGIDGVADPEKTAIVAALKKMTSNAATVYASGLNVADVQAKLARDKATRSGGDPVAAMDARRASAEALLGWRVFGIEDSQSKFVAATRDLVNAWSAPKVASAYKAKWPQLAPPTLKFAPVPAGLPNDTVHVVFETYPITSVSSATPVSVYSNAPPPPPPPSAPAKAVRFHALFLADGGRTWVVFGADESLLAAKARVVMPSGAAQDRLGARGDLAVLQNGRMGAGGFFTPFAVATSQHQPRVLLAGSTSGAIDFYDSHPADSGLTAFPFTITAQDAPAAAVTTIHVSKAAIDDVRQVVMSMLQ